MRSGRPVAASLAAVRERIAAAERRFGRPPGSVALVAVAKTRPASLIREAWEAGQHRFGENFVQEAVEKLDELSDLAGPGGIEWHFVGALQANKSRTVAERFDWVHTVDRVRIARRLSDQRPAWLAPLNVCLQVNVSGEAVQVRGGPFPSRRPRFGGGRASPAAAAGPDGHSPAGRRARRAAGRAAPPGRGP